PLPPAVWTALLVALGALSRGGRQVAATLAGVALAPGRDAPPRGLLPYARALCLGGASPSADELALATYRRAAERGEPGAAAALGAELRSRALGAVRAGRRLEAVALLRESRALLCVVPARPG
ncbi:MAG: hypothetical protein HY908_29255, partial [Myxococcales bacterium]|nr:hypothetical protein [Myxococcales bacterium]